MMVLELLVADNFLLTGMSMEFFYVNEVLLYFIGGA